MRFILICIILLGNVFAFEIKKNNEIVSLNYEYLDGNYLSEQNYSFNDESGILVKFNEESSDLISEFEAKYSLELQEVLIIGYYLYKSDLSIIELLPNIIEEENIKTVKPNWKKFRKKK